MPSPAETHDAIATVATLSAAADLDPVDLALAPMIADAQTSVPALLTPAQTAELLGVGVKTLERWRSTGDGPRFVKLSPGTVRYRAVDLNQFVAQRIKANTLP
ncbi:helix-turn-helix transcriptional regulator [Novosphingobium panipatense]|uniref:helix-turn-helix transcriptional regulator n=1 Tax=Novosphingobium panipatense TaxID=428991 RepID=UPI00361CE321